MLTLNSVEVTYSNVIEALRGISLKVPEGGLIAVLGSNGAGKSTTLKAISGLISVELGKVSHGSIEFEGQRIDRLAPEVIAKMGILQVLEGRKVLPHLTGEENLRLGSYILGTAAPVKRDLDRIYGYFPRLKDVRHKASGYCSGGEQQMLVMGRAMMGHPKLMMLDEPSLGLSPMMSREIFDTIKRINEEEKTSILLVEQNAAAALSLAHHGYVLENGRVVLDEPAEKLQQNEDVKEFYLGLSQVGKRKSYRDVKHYKRRKRWL